MYTINELACYGAELPAPFYLALTVYRYKKFGKDAFSDGRKRKRYSPELKKEVVKAYMNGEGSFLQLALKYGISTDDVVRKWYKLYKDEIAGTAQE